VDGLRDAEAVVTPLGHVRRVVRVAGFGAVTAAMLPAYALRDRLASASERDAIRDRWVRRWCEALLRLFAIDVEVHGDTHEHEGGLLVIANHRSTIDIAVLLGTFGGHMVSRADLAEWPLVGAAARKVGTVFVDREDAVSGASAVRAMRDILKSGGTVIVFPEGTTFADDDVRPFHGGAFVAALHTGARVLPVGLAYERGSGAAFVGETFPQHLSRMSAAPPTRVVMRIGKPIAIAERARSVALRDASHAAVQSLVREARAIVDVPKPG
jgi:1-acyl-sn-glycerol-3-phosphate acyltransferase